MEDLHCAACGHTIEIKVADIESILKQYTGECERCNATTTLWMEHGAQVQPEPKQTCEQCGSTNIITIHAGDAVFRTICKDCVEGVYDE